MPNRKVLREAAKHRRRKSKFARRVYRQHRQDVPYLILQLAGPTQAAHDQAFDLLGEMGDTIVSELLEALQDPTLEPDAADEVVSLLGVAGDQRAGPTLWAFFQANRDDPERASTAAMSLASLGDTRVLPYVREDLEAADEESVANAVSSLIFLGELEDVDRLRATHLRHLTNHEIRTGVANAILTILGETDRATLNRTLDEIQTNPSCRALWTDIWHILDTEFGQKP